MTPCRQCGKEHITHYNKPACKAHSASDPTKPCRKAPLDGSSVCRSHGGASPLAVAKAKERRSLMSAEGEIATLMREVDLPDQHPIDGLLEVVRVSGAMMRLLTIKVGELRHEPGDVELSVSEEGDLLERPAQGFWMPNHQREMIPHSHVQLLRIWTERYERACKTALDANIDERLVRNAEQTSDTMFKALGDALDSAELTPVQRDSIVASLAASLRKLGPLELA